MSEPIDIAIIGGGPAGIAAGACAAKNKATHLLFEKGEVANTIYEYQRRKHVMAEPPNLPLRGLVPFEESSREEILEKWNAIIKDYGIKYRRSEVLSIERIENNLFKVTSASGDPVIAKNVVLSLGIQGAPRKLGCPGEEQPHVAYTLANPDEFQNEDILVVGAGDAAIENAIALSKNNRVSIVNRSGEFPRAKSGNIALILNAIEQKRIRCFYNSSVKLVEARRVVLNTAEGEVTQKCNRIIARLGAVPPRGFLEKCGLKFPSKDPNAVPVVSERYESEIPGLYVVGSLIGYPLIKHALNQGDEVVKHILGMEVIPADQELIEQVLKPLRGTVEERLKFIRNALPLYADLSTAQFRELILESTVHHKTAGQKVFEKDEYSDTFFSVVYGGVMIAPPGQQPIKMGPGEYFGEIGLLSGRRRSATVLADTDAGDTILLETPRKQMLKLMRSVQSVTTALDQSFAERVFRLSTFPDISGDVAKDLARRSQRKDFRKGEVIFKQGDIGDALYVIRKGSVKISLQGDNGKELTLTYVAAGNFVGEMSLLTNEPEQRSATVTAAVPCETLKISRDDFRAVFAENQKLRENIMETAQRRWLENRNISPSKRSAELLDFLLQEGVSDADNVLVIDSDLCVGCDNCEKACAATHGGYSRLDRKGGKSYASVQVPISCRHCENPLCMIDCPPDALRRLPNGEVIIQDTCIGCGNCQRNCPYGVIQMIHEKKTGIGSLLQMFQGLFHEPEEGPAKAAKCDLCKSLPSGPACVRSCPTGAAMRINPKTLAKLISERE